MLLTNDGTLPLASADGLAIIGAFAQSPRFQGAGSSLVNATQVTTAIDACAARGAEVTFALGYDASTGETNDALVADAVAAAMEASAVLLMVGLPATAETEGLDRTHLGIPEGHVRLIEAVTAANPRTVVAVSAGAPVEMPWADLPAAVLLSYLGGQASGEALIDVVLGDAEPAGQARRVHPDACRGPSLGRQLRDAPHSGRVPRGPQRGLPLPRHLGRRPRASPLATDSDTPPSSSAHPRRECPVARAR